jgi:hypothetical protein
MGMDFSILSDYVPARAARLVRWASWLIRRVPASLLSRGRGTGGGLPMAAVCHRAVAALAVVLLAAVAAGRLMGPHPLHRQSGRRRAGRIRRQVDRGVGQLIDFNRRAGVFVAEAAARIGPVIACSTREGV